MIGTGAYEVIVIGGGPAGLSSATAAKHSGAQRVLVIERESWLGGILPQCIHTGFGLFEFKEELTGPEYASRWIAKAIEAGVEFLTETSVLKISGALSSEGTREVVVSGGITGVKTLRAAAVVLAMGCREKPLGAIGIPGSRCSGVLTAGSAQRLVNIEGVMPGKEFVILGSGDIGLIMARRMTLEGGKVCMVCERMDRPGGLERNVIQCLDDYHIPLLLRSTILEIHGRKRVEGVTVGQFDEEGLLVPDSIRKVPCDTVLLSAGLIPENELSCEAGIRLDPITRGPVADSYMQTELPGVFACGNVLKVYDLVDEVSREAMYAGHNAAAYAAKNRPGMKEVCASAAGKSAVTGPSLYRDRAHPDEGKRQIRCTICPVGCLLAVELGSDNNASVQGNRCERGIQFARDEIILPVRTLTTCARVEEIVRSADETKTIQREIAVRTDKPIPLAKMLTAASMIRRHIIRRKVHSGEVIRKNIAKTGANVIVTRD